MHVLVLHLYLVSLDFIYKHPQNLVWYQHMVANKCLDEW